MSEQPRAVGTERLADEWATALDGATPAASADRVSGYLRDGLESLIAALTAEPFDSRPGFELGAGLVAEDLIDAHGLERSIGLLGVALPELTGADAGRVVALLGALAGGVLDSVGGSALDNERRQHLTDALFHEVFTSSSLGIALSELDGTIVELNNAFGTIVGSDPAELVGTHLEKLFFPADADSLKRYYQELVEGQYGRFQRRKRLQDPTGEPVWTRIAAAPLFEADDEVSRLVTVVEDVSQLDLLEQQMIRRAREDELTGLPNRVRLVTQLQDMIERAEPGTALALCTVDIDGFAVVNEGMGRELGDRLLRSVGTRIRALVPEETALVARTGPDEFCVVLTEPADANSLGALAIAINAELAEPVYLDKRSISVSAGIGGALLPARGLHAEELLRAADTALTRAKWSGRGQWALYDPDEDAEHRERFADAAAMPLAWENGEVTLTYEPLVELETGRPMAVQALLRWEQPPAPDEPGDEVDDDVEIAGPAEIAEPAQPRVIDHARCLVLAEETGLVVQLGSWMLREACIELQRCRDRLGGSPPVMQIALTRNLAQDPDLVGIVRKVLTETGLTARSLGLGFPREVLADDRGDARDNVETLADIGIRTQLLGAGDGLGYLELLMDLPLEATEMAHPIVSRLRGSDPDSPLCRMVANQLPMVRDLDVHVVVRGLTEADQAAWWREAGADFGTGPYFAAPMSGAELVAWLRTHEGER